MYAIRRAACPSVGDSPNQTLLEKLGFVRSVRRLGRSRLPAALVRAL
jgi:hypothetical protein